VFNVPCHFFQHAVARHVLDQAHKRFDLRMKAGNARLQRSFRRRDRWELSEESQIAQRRENTTAGDNF
jgi:hypothetical protein